MAAFEHLDDKICRDIASVLLFAVKALDEPPRHTSQEHKQARRLAAKCLVALGELSTELTPARVRDILDYDPDTGTLTWRERTPRPECEAIDRAWNTRFVGRPAGRIGTHGHHYVNISVAPYKMKNLAAHRLAWAHFHGEWPVGAIDHANRDPSDNRIANLRLATQAQNLQNASLRSDNTSGVKGVYWIKKEQKWGAYININKKPRRLGAFASKEDAITARQAAARKHFGEFANETEVEASSESGSHEPECS